jgi:hypothetical protein
MSANGFNHGLYLHAAAIPLLSRRPDLVIIG